MMVHTISGFTGQYRFLSNFHQAPVLFEGIEYPTAEHAFQAAKSTDPGVRQKVLEAPTPSKAKYAGRSLQLRDDWEQTKLHYMALIVGSKFSDAALSSLLLETGDSILVEENSWCDNFWGVCTSHPHQGRAGLNYLGVILMSVRAANKKYGHGK